MASIKTIKQAIIDELSARENLSQAELVDYEDQFCRNLRMRSCGLLTTDIARYDGSHQLFVYAEELAVNDDWLVVIRQQGYEEYHEILR